MTPADEIPRAVSRANTYHTLAQVFCPPAGWSDTLRDALRELDVELAEAMEAVSDDRESADVAYAKLFLGPFEIHAPPYASMYLEPEGRLMGPVSEAAEQAYAEAGLAPGAGPREAPDHITRELEFMYFLAFQEATTSEQVWTERQRRFFVGHLGRWLPELAAAMIEAGSHPFYDSLGRLLRIFAEGELAWFTDAGQPDPAPSDAGAPSRQV
jgi:putative dimethyl sulfoxide reductase chaperone